MPEYLIRLVQVHESFRKAELEALAEVAKTAIEFVYYSEDSPFCIVRLASDSAATSVISRSILSQGVYELWGQGTTYDALHASVKALSKAKWSQYESCPFRFSLDGYRGTKAQAEQRDIIESFFYLGFKGPIRMRDPDVSFKIFEDYGDKASEPKHLYLGRFVAASGRDAKTTYDLKKRHYISTTSMDAELALLTANIALAGPGKLFYDPFMGTGGFPVACAHYGAIVCGSDIDGRSIRGTGGSARKGQTGKMDVRGNFKQYDLESRYLGAFVSDLTNTPLRIPQHSSEGSKRGYLDGIVCDPPYGIREGLKVLGSRDKLNDTERTTHSDRYKEPTYIPPKKPYSFTAILDDMLAFAVATLVDDGRLSMWMPTANDEDVELIIPTHPCLEIVSVCVQPFNKWSRRLLTYRRLPELQISAGTLEKAKREYEQGVKADELNDFRRKYFQGFKEFERLRQKPGNGEELDDLKGISGKWRENSRSS
ncbi:tRNA guanosine-2'-O-methyltransferas-like protein TRM11 [Lentithecium fluviatile CBS 122367]|uniref:tRNA (guanine(10)-N(2))-methyltransferase n=1 Tax=Lentithecium fluviatile CBS 122367 TaxID=1168545 RepID=A0A6G1JLG7_9PLEO|nr:tRNA guanosine-2'-O-methyltransferas-like protein TRM11 [Lentithecium fluviatile CBS 122367]